MRYISLNKDNDSRLQNVEGYKITNKQCECANDIWHAVRTRRDFTDHRNKTQKHKMGFTHSQQASYVIVYVLMQT